MSDDLLARLESATGPDRELDAAIAVAFGKCLLINGHTWQLDPQNGTAIYNPPRFTASIDAALTMVGDNDWRVEDHPLAGPCAVVGDNDAYAPTPALAICIAALRARRGV